MKLLLFVFILFILINYLQVEAKDKSLEKKRTKNNNIKKYLNRNSAKHPKQRSSKQAKRQKWRRKKYSERKVKRKFKTERNVNWPLSPAFNPAEHISCSTVFCCPSPVKFAIAIW